MEWAHTLVTAEQNTAENGYGPAAGVAAGVAASTAEAIADSGSGGGGGTGGGGEERGLREAEHGGLYSGAREDTLNCFTAQQRFNGFTAQQRFNCFTAQTATRCSQPFLESTRCSGYARGDAAFTTPTLALLQQERRELLAAWARLYGREHLPTCDEAV